MVTTVLRITALCAAIKRADQCKGSACYEGSTGTGDG